MAIKFKRFSTKSPKLCITRPIAKVVVVVAEILTRIRIECNKYGGLIEVWLPTPEWNVHQNWMFPLHLDRSNDVVHHLEHCLFAWCFKWICNLHTTLILWLFLGDLSTEYSLFPKTFLDLVYIWKLKSFFPSSNVFSCIIHLHFFKEIVKDIFVVMLN